MYKTPPSSHNQRWWRADNDPWLTPAERIVFALVASAGAIWNCSLALGLSWACLGAETNQVGRCQASGDCITFILHSLITASVLSIFHVVPFNRRLRGIILLLYSVMTILLPLWPIWVAYLIF